MLPLYSISAVDESHGEGNWEKGRGNSDGQYSVSLRVPTSDSEVEAHNQYHLQEQYEETERHDFEEAQSHYPPPPYAIRGYESPSQLTSLNSCMDGYRNRAVGYGYGPTMYQAQAEVVEV
jgi:hypothetical protein